jgi:TonB-linked SusC/RagA family outer membrane protein
MKLTAIILFTACISVSAKGYTQKVTLSVKNATLDEVFTQIRQQTGYVFFYSYRDLKDAKAVTINLKDADILTAVKACLYGQPFNFSIEDKTVFVTKKPTENNSEGEQTIPPIDVHGRVVNEKGEPVAGATVKIKGSDKGTSANENGEFILTNVDVNTTLVISGVNIETLEVKLNARTYLIITAKTKVGEEEGVEVEVNKGYYRTSKKLNTGNVSKITSADIQKQPVSSPLEAIQGRMPGVFVQQGTGLPGGGLKVEVRGRNSLRDGTSGSINGNLPLYIIDGVPFTSTSLTSRLATSSLLSYGDPLAAINPNDIESIEVLKDADATAIYGSRGANGVVLITTKRSTVGKTKVDADVYTSAGKVGHFMKLLNTSQYVAMRREGFANDGATPDFGNAIDLLYWDTTRYTDWQKVLIGGTAHATNAQVSVSGGNALTQFSLGGAYYRETSVFPGDNAFQRISGRLSVTHQSQNKKLKVEGSVNYSSSLNNLPAIDFTGQATSLVPIAPALFDDQGNLNWESSTWTNPLAAKEQKYSNTTDNLISNASLSYEIIPGLHIKSSFGYTTVQVNENVINPLSSFDPLFLSYGLTASSFFGENSFKTWIIEPQAEYTRKIKKGVFTFLFGATFQQSTQQGKGLEADGYTNDAFLQNINLATSISVLENNYSQYNYTAAFGRLNYNWKEKYIINVTGRRDGSSRFGPGKQFANFGAIGTAWIFSDENFAIKHLPFLTFGKLHLSYGTTGSDAIGNYQYLPTWSATTYPYAYTSGLMLNRLANPDYSWELNKKFETGIELGFLKDRIRFSSSFYLNRSSNQLVGLPLPAITGQSSVQFNFPATVENRGWEFQVSTSNIKNSNFQWTTDLNLTLPSNKLIQFPDITKFPAYNVKYDVGNSIYTYKGYQMKQVDPQTGIYTYVDRNNDGVISAPSDYAGIKKLTQTLFGGINNTLRYKNLQLDFFIQFVQQNGYDYRLSFGVPGTMSNQPTDVLKRWQKPGDHTGVQLFTATDPTGAISTAYSRAISSDDLITDASFIRLKNISFSWQLPGSWIKKAKLSDSRLYVEAQNVLTITKYMGLDPETQYTTKLPPLRVIAIGIHLSL